MKLMPSIVQKHYDNEMKKNDAKPKKHYEVFMMFDTEQNRDTSIKKVRKYLKLSDIIHLEKSCSTVFHNKKFSKPFYSWEAILNISNTTRLMDNVITNKLKMASCRPKKYIKMPTTKQIGRNIVKLERIDYKITKLLQDLKPKELKGLDSNLKLRDDLIKKVLKIYKSQSPASIDFTILQIAKRF